MLNQLMGGSDGDGGVGNVRSDNADKDGSYEGSDNSVINAAILVMTLLLLVSW